ncbi:MULTISPECIES: hypothetical protein [unclassified Moorena]|uniref:hypothetical protein n=1 Tax=unclassified Moorena TaxID=2683338 RepID=UPI0014015265|nr:MULTISPECIES: hypothetical protein [unclassified Moorena]NEO13360.1 hypothetical protein [Moorena sp. SIO3E8]NEP99652.1 hypothetical protein [Moorena sp. SIO3F7]
MIITSKTIRISFILLPDPKLPTPYSLLPTPYSLLPTPYWLTADGLMLTDSC